MSHLKRSLWLLAWTTWLLLGLGLHHQLPRNLGPPICKPPLNPDESFEGSLRGDPAFATKEVEPSTGTVIFRRRSAKTGEVELVIHGEGLPNDDREYSVQSLAGFVVERDRMRASGDWLSMPKNAFAGRPSGLIRLYDLRTGERREYPGLGKLTAVHQERPWMLFHGLTPDGLRERVVALDASSGRIMLDMTIPAGAYRRWWNPQFIGDRAAVVFGQNKEKPRIEIRALPGGELLNVLDGWTPFRSSSADGKLAYSRIKNFTGDGVEVFNALNGQRLLVDETTTPLNYDGAYYTPSFSADGRYLLAPTNGVLFDLTTGDRTWRGSDHERALFIVHPDQFEVAEVRSISQAAWSPWFQTFALRNVADGSLACRTWRSITNRGKANETDERRTLIFIDGAIHRLPPPPNYPLLALCQLILALPLILLWLLLRFRRKKRALSVRTYCVTRRKSFG